MKDPLSNPLPTEDVSYESQVHNPLSTAAAATMRPETLERIDVVVRRKERERNDLALVLQTEHGQAFLMRLMDHCGLYAPTFSVSHASASFNDGRRHVGKWIMDEIHSIDPELYPQLLLSHVKRQKRLESIEVGIKGTKKAKV